MRIEWATRILVVFVTWVGSLQGAAVEGPVCDREHLRELMDVVEATKGAAENNPADQELYESYKAALALYDETVTACADRPDLMLQAGGSGCAPGRMAALMDVVETAKAALEDNPSDPAVLEGYRAALAQYDGTAAVCTGASRIRIDDQILFNGSEEDLQCNGPSVTFEDGIPTTWAVIDNTGGTGIKWVTTADPACEITNHTNGSGEAACADSDAAGYPAVPYDTELLSNPFDLSGFGAAVLDVKAYYNDITTGGNDRFEVDVWDGFSWTNELSWDEDHMPEDFTLNLSAYAGLPAVQVRFRYFGDGFDWYVQVDDIALTCVAAGPPAIEVDPAALTAVQNLHVQSTQPMTVTNSGGSALDWNVVEDDSACDSPTDIPWLSVSPDTGTTVPLDSTVIDVSFDSIGMSPGDYTANLCVDSNDPATPMVQVPATLTVVPPDYLECNGDMVTFEDGIPSGWAVIDNTGGTGIVWVTTDHPACEIPNRTNGAGEAACADSDAAGYPAVPYDTELWSPPIDLTGFGSVVLNVKAYYRDISTGLNDRFEVDVWDGAVWTNELSWDEDHEPEDFSLNLSAYAGLSDVRVRFRYFGNGYDWYAQVDDIALTCGPAGAPVIGVSPALLGAEQGADVQSTLQLQVSNSGGSSLNWSIVEDDTACDSPADVPWVSVSPDMGTTLPLDSTAVDVTFDSTGLAPGIYAANLCVNSNDSVTPNVQVPLILTVSPPFVLTCNGDLADFETGIPLGWQVVDNEGTGVVWSTIAGSGETGNFTGGAGDAATASSDRAGPVPYDTELRTSAISLSNWLPGDIISLEYLANYQNFAYRDYLDVDISPDGGFTWATLLSWNEDHGEFRKPVGETVSIDLSSYAGLSDVRLRWHYFDPTDDDYDWYAQLDEVGLTCTFVNEPPAVTVVPESQSVHYSDEIGPVTITASDRILEVLSASTSWSEDGGPFNPGLPDFLYLSAPSCADSGGGMQNCNWSISGAVDVSEGMYTIRVTVADDFGGVNVNDIQIQVRPEAAAVEFDNDNPVGVEVAAPGGSSGSFSIIADVAEKQPDEAAGGAGAVAPGDITRANVTVTLVPVGPGAAQSPITCVTSVAPDGYAGELTVVCDFTGVPVDAYTVQVVVDGGYYSGAGEDVLAVFDASLGFTTGGGWFYWPGTPEKTNFGYTMKYNKKATKVQGSLLLIRHLSDGSIYRVKSNAIYGLSLGEVGGPAPFGWASFSGKCTYLEPGMLEPEGNHEFVAYVEDHGEPGKAADRFWIEVHDRNGVVIPVMSLDRDATDHAETLGGGNIVVPHRK